MLKEQALQSIIQNFQNSATVYVYLQLVKDKIGLARTYHANTDTANQYQYKEAMQMIAAATDKFGLSNPAANELENLRQSILSKNLHIVSENTTIPNKPFRCLVNYKTSTPSTIAYFEFLWKQRIIDKIRMSLFKRYVLPKHT